MYDGMLADFRNRRSDEPLAAESLPWKVVVLLFCFAILQVVAGILYPTVFGAPLQQF